MNEHNNGECEPLSNDGKATSGFGHNGYLEASPNPAIATTDLFQFKLQYSRDEARKMLDIGVRTLDRLIAGKQLPVRRIGRRVLITRDALEKFIKRDHETGATVH